MEPSVPVAIFTSNQQAKWSLLVDNFSLHKNAAACLHFFRQTFSKTDESYCACLLMLVNLIQTEENMIERDKAVQMAILVRSLADYCFDEVFQRLYPENAKSMFLECSSRLALLLESECGCMECLNVIPGLQGAQIAHKMPRLNPHEAFPFEPSLSSIYNSTVLCDNVPISVDLLVDIVTGSNFGDSFSLEAKNEASLLAICITMSWLFYQTYRTITGALEDIFRDMLHFANSYGLAIESKRDLCRLDARLLRKLSRSGAFWVGQKPLFKFKIKVGTSLYKLLLAYRKQLTKDRCLFDPNYESLKKMIKDTASLSTNTPFCEEEALSSDRTNQECSDEITGSVDKGEGDSPHPVNTSPCFKQVSEEHLLALDALLGEGEDGDRLKSQTTLSDINSQEDLSDLEETCEKYLTLEEFERELSQL
ncbi:orf48 [Alcelaphine gammaherpesvirus 2]|uniref:Orf48 n=1 Tax=Alcelaphine gammaherpesvirus 2 TaxID=138184 RepID=A0A068A9X2_9GAMA|nr:orf48 [Alcelaphine gammaherpesvirus 2]AIA62084.1 orf48 [Alcelaphine gammaherpesvirus 2]